MLQLFPDYLGGETQSREQTQSEATLDLDDASPSASNGYGIDRYNYYIDRNAGDNVGALAESK